MSPGFPESLFEVLASEIGAEAHFEKAMSGPAPGTDPFREGLFDLGWICSTSFVDLALREDDPSIQLVGVAWVPDDPDTAGRPVYFGDLVVRTGSPVSALSDLAGCRVGCNDEVSLSGHHALRIAIKGLGANPDDFAELVFTGSHDNSLDALAEAEVDACIIDSVIRSVRARRDPWVASLRIVDRLGPWPVQPLVARRNMAGSDVSRISSMLIEASNRPAIRAELAAAGLVGLVPIDDAHYAPVQAALDTVRSVAKSFPSL